MGKVPAGTLVSSDWLGLIEFIRTIDVEYQ